MLVPVIGMTVLADRVVGMSEGAARVRDRNNGSIYMRGGISMDLNCERQTYKQSFRNEQHDLDAVDDWGMCNSGLKKSDALVSLYRLAYSIRTANFIELLYLESGSMQQ